MRKGWARAVLGILVVTLLCGSMSVSAETYDKSQTVYAMGGAHLDNMWMWTEGETATNTHDTYSYALQLLEKNPEYKFNTSTAKSYLYIQEYYPEIMDDILEAYKAGRWGFSSFYVQGDMKMPMAESLVRQGLYAQQIFEEIFNARAKVNIMPDTFGAGWIFPQIARGTGYEYVQAWRPTSPIASFFNWKGVDGTSIPYYSATPQYLAMTPRLDVKEAVDGVRSQGLTKSFYFTGRGDKGGGPTQELLDHIAEINQSEKYPKVIWSLNEEYFNDLTDEEWALLPDYQAGLFYDICNGVYTSQAQMKKYLRLAETSVVQTEGASVFADWLGTSAYPVQDLAVVWDKMLTQHFHDAIAGVCQNEPVVNSWNDYEIALNLLKKSFNSALGGIYSRVNTSGEGVPLVVYNPLSVKRAETVSTTVTFDGEVKGVKLYDAAGKEIPVQVRSASGNTAEIVFLAEDIPSMGYAVYQAVPVETTAAYTTSVSADGHTLENEFFTVEINETTGNICRIYDKVNKREVLANGKEIEYQLLTDTNNPWGYHHAEVVAEPYACLGENSKPKIEIVENGPSRAVIRVTRKFRSERAQKPSVYTQDITLSTGVNRVDVKNTIDWNERKMLLKLSVPTSVKNKEATYDMSDGVVTRLVNNDYHNEVCGQKWADITNADGRYGVSLMNDSRYGYDMPNENTLRLSLLRSSRTEDPVADLGVHETSISIYPHVGGWEEGKTQVAAYAFNYPLTVTQTDSHEGDLPARLSFVKVSNEDVMITATKLSEDTQADYAGCEEKYDSEIVLRLTELNGNKSKNVILSFPSEILNAEKTDMMEEKGKSLKFEGNKLTTTLTKYEIQTIKLRLADNAYKADLPVSTPVNLNAAFNLRGITVDGEVVDNGLDGARSLSAAKTPQTFMSNNVQFNMGGLDAGVLNAVRADGQTIALPQDTYEASYLVACSTGEETVVSAPVTVNYTDGTASTATLEFRNWTAYGSWKEDPITHPIALAYTHYHDGGEDAIEMRANLFLNAISLDDTKTVESITLPQNENIKLLALTMADNVEGTNAPLTSATVTEASGFMDVLASVWIYAAIGVVVVAAAVAVLLWWLKAKRRTVVSEQEEQV